MENQFQKWGAFFLPAVIKPSKCLLSYKITENFLGFWQIQGSYLTKKFAFNLKRPILVFWEDNFGLTVLFTWGLQTLYICV